jgi:acetyl-CoA acetyltransferase
LTFASIAEFTWVKRNSKCQDAAYLSRHIGHRAGLSIEAPAITLNRLCGSGFQSVISAVQDITTGDAQVVLTGGTENMSQAPYALRNVRFGTRYGVEWVSWRTIMIFFLWISLKVNFQIVIQKVNHWKTRLRMVSWTHIPRKRPWP